MESISRYIEREVVTLDDGSDYTRAILRECDLLYRGGEFRTDGATFIDCRIKFEADGVRARDLQRAIFRSFYAQGARTLWIDKDGNHGPLWPRDAV